MLNCILRSPVLSLVLLAGGLTVLPAQTVKLKPETTKAFNAYVSSVEAALPQGAGGWYVLENATAIAEAKAGEVIVRRFEPDQAPKALIHDWGGVMFVAGRTPQEAADVLLDYDKHADIYAEVLEGKTLERNGSKLRSYLRLRKKKVITVVLDTKHDVSFRNGAGDRLHIASISSEIREVKKPGEPEESLLPVGEDGGFLWRLNAYWNLVPMEGGTLVECRTVSLSRDIPFMVTFIVKPFVTGLPRESLIATMEATRDALKAD